MGCISWVAYSQKAVETHCHCVVPENDGPVHCVHERALNKVRSNSLKDLASNAEACTAKYFCLPGQIPRLFGMFIVSLGIFFGSRRSVAVDPGIDYRAPRTPLAINHSEHIQIALDLVTGSRSAREWSRSARSSRSSCAYVDSCGAEKRPKMRKGRRLESDMAGLTWRKGK